MISSALLQKHGKKIGVEKVLKIKWFLTEIDFGIHWLQSRLPNGYDFIIQLVHSEVLSYSSF